MSDSTRNGLYSVHVDMLDGHPGRGSGVVVFHDGKILGGDAMLFYTGSYTVRGPTLKGEVLVNQHTRIAGTNPLFGGQQVSIGFSGTFSDTGAKVSGSALVGKNSQLFEASLRKLAE